MSVIGYDFGNLNSYISAARQGGIDVLTNDYSLHATPTCVSFGNKSRVMGFAARQQVNTNFKSTVINFKHLLGRKFSDPIVQHYKNYVPCEVVQLPDDNIGFKVVYLDEVRYLTPEQVTAAFLVKLKQLTEMSLSSKVHECVLSVPFYFTETQRRSLISAAKIAELNLLDIVNENTAVGVAYGIYKGSTFPPEKDPPKIVAFVDVGHSSSQATLMAFNDHKVSVIGATYDITVGGLFFDEVIREHFYKIFLEKYNIDAKKNPRAWLRLLDESEKIKKQMSANNTPIPLNIECFMDDKDVFAQMQRLEFEELASPLFEKLNILLTTLINQSGIEVDNIGEVELIGGSSRIPFIKSMISKFFKREPKTTMNQDEATVRGAALQCAILSPNIKIKEFTICEAPREAVQNEETKLGINLDECIKFEKYMQELDLAEKLKADSKNAVEEYCYDMRDKLTESLTGFVTLEETDKFLGLLAETEEWLYNEGENAERVVYEKKLNELRSVIETPIRQRQKELEEKAKVEAKAKADAEAKLKAEAEAKLKAEEEAKLKAEAKVNQAEVKVDQVEAEANQAKTQSIDEEKKESMEVF